MLQYFSLYLYFTVAVLILVGTHRRSTQTHLLHKTLVRCIGVGDLGYDGYLGDNTSTECAGAKNAKYIREKKKN